MSEQKQMLLKKSLRYAVMPAVVPRIKNFDFNFGYVAYLIVYLFSITGLFQVTHPYLKPGNIGRYGIRHVLLEGYKNLTWSRKHLDQIILFGMVVICFALVLGQLLLLLISLVSLTGTAIAGSGVTAGFLRTTPPDYDIAFMMMDRVFGVPDVFNSCIEQGIPCNPRFAALAPTPWPMHIGLHAMFAFYSQAMLLIAGVIVLYYLFVIVAETAQTGTPFGQRFASIYAPLRLILCILLLIPLANGINTGQYFLLNVAKWGSSFGTNTWKIFNVSLNNTLGLAHSNLVIKPNAPDVTPLVQFYHLVNACRASYFMLYGSRRIEPYFENGAWSNSFVTALGEADHREKKTIRINYGVPGDETVYCGGITMELNDLDNPYAFAIYNIYYNFLVLLWNSPVIQEMTAKHAAMAYHTERRRDTLPCPPQWTTGCVGKPPVGYLSDMITSTQALLNANLAAVVGASVADYFELDYAANQLDMGWGGAGLWFNKISQVNGGVVTAVFSKPYGAKMPALMEHVVQEKKKKAPGMAFFDKYTPALPEESEEQITWPDTPELDKEIARHLNNVHKLFLDDNLDPTPKDRETNPLGAILAAIFGADGLFDLRENNSVHPLAQMSGLGKSIIESAIQNISLGLAASFGSGVFSQGNSPDDKLATKALEGKANLAVTIGTIALTTGFLLYYILPFLPFIYFFFAVGKWIKSVFEAMVAVPLWALAHLKIDGDGVSGPAAKNGYVLLLEIFLRPVLTVFGLIAAISIFSAMAVMLNELFDLAAANLSGHDTGASPGVYAPGDGPRRFFEIEYYRSGVDQFFFTVLYAVLIYIMAIANFKLIDLIPNSILRWIGEGVESFGDKAEDAADNLIKYAAIGGGTLGGQLTSALKDGANFAGKTGGSLQISK